MGLQEGKAQKSSACLAIEGGKCYKVLVRVLIETYLIQIANSSPGIRRGRQVCKAVCVNEAGQNIWKMGSPLLL